MDVRVAEKNVDAGITGSVEMTFAAGEQDTKIKAISKTVTMFLIFIDYEIVATPTTIAMELVQRLGARGRSREAVLC